MKLKLIHKMWFDLALFLAAPCNKSRSKSRQTYREIYSQTWQIKHRFMIP